MIFPAGLHTKALSGRKSEHREFVKDGSLPCRYRPGDVYAVQAPKGRSRPALGRIRILATHKQQLGEISEESARREGFKTRDQFIEHWCQLHGEFVPEAEVWVLVFVPERDEVRLLAKDSSRGYTSDPRMALDEEPEAIDQESQGRISAKASEDFQKAEKPLSARVAAIEGKVRPQQLASLRKRVEGLERAVGDQAA